MKASLVFLFIVFTAVNLYSQIDTPTQNTIDNDSPFTMTPNNLDLFTNEPNPDGILKPESDFSFGEGEKFANNGSKFDEKYKNNFSDGDKKMSEEFKSDQYLGDFKSNSGYVKIICRDHEYPDGDRVRVYVNDVMVKSDILLDYDYKGFTIKLVSGFNKIDFEALNQGSSGPNTAEFRVFDDQGKMVSQNQWNLATGVKATMIIVKE